MFSLFEEKGRNELVILGLVCIAAIGTVIILLISRPVLVKPSIKLPTIMQEEPEVIEEVRVKVPVLYCMKHVIPSPYDKPIPLFVQSESKVVGCNTYIHHSFNPYDAASYSSIKEDKSIIEISCEEAELLAKQWLGNQ